MDPIRKSEEVLTEIVELPTGGKYYSSESSLSSGKIEIKYATAKNEDILSNKNLINKKTAIDAFIKSLLVDNTIDINELLVPDYMALFYACRIVTYGAQYELDSIKCKQCDHINNGVVVNLSDRDEKILSYDEKELINGIEVTPDGKFNMTLPFSKKKVTIKFLNHGDEMNLILGKNSNKSSLEYATNNAVTSVLQRMIVEVDGVDSSSPLELKRAIDNLPSRDTTQIRMVYQLLLPDIDNSFDFICESCGYSERMGIPLGITFLNPTAKR